MSDKCEHKKWKPFILKLETEECVDCGITDLDLEEEEILARTKSEMDALRRKLEIAIVELGNIDRKLLPWTSADIYESDDSIDHIAVMVREALEKIRSEK